MERTVLSMNRTSSSALLQLQNQFYCSPGGRGACLLPGASDGSLPQTPEGGGSPVEEPGILFPSSSSAPLSAAADPGDSLIPKTYALVRDFIRHHAELMPSAATSWFGCSPDDDRRAAETLERIGERLIEKHGTAFIGMINRLHISQRSDLETIQRVASEMFGDGEMNWGRVVSFIAFGAVMGSHLKKIQREDCIDDVAMQITQYLAGQKREWLEAHNGWDGFSQFFHENNAEESAKKALMWIACFGIAGASIMHLFR
ncbi:induced myeloid leukemia cell differentiation protein Mcl-1 homolog [Carcharodon carcharias]|uniref:induced myeloid leukemia cell differentiation protein Mcl-1 homolog n=1 Tax=Carcharodon carcharias TaxID=13397 RepID=UPI001B7F387F|nr:induced myeloid leukemia cell differentiation protein Mcl-1 homolog [Carcharodon carcharias]